MCCFREEGTNLINVIFPYMEMYLLKNSTIGRFLYLANPLPWTMTSGSPAASPRWVRRIYAKHQCKFQCDIVFVMATLAVKAPEGGLSHATNYLQYCQSWTVGLFSQVSEEISRDEICMSIQVVEFRWFELHSDYDSHQILART